MKRVAVVGGGWAGIAAAVHAVQRGHHVTLLEMAPRLGGRARRVEVDGLSVDNGQHILIGAYTRTLALMRQVGVEPEQVFDRRPLELLYPDGTGLRLPAGAPVLAFVRGVLAAPGWRVADRASLLRAAAAWALKGFRAAPQATVATLARRLTPRLRDDLIEPLCVAALNTPAHEASAGVFLRVLRDALFSGPGSADLLLPRRSLSDLLPDPAQAWLAAAGADVRLGQRAARLARDGSRWRLDDEPYDGVVLACSAAEASRLARDTSPDWATTAQNFHYEPIVSVYFDSPGSRLARPMIALRGEPAQFVFDLGQLAAHPGRFVSVISGARAAVERGAGATADAARAQLLSAFAPGTWATPPRLLRVLAEKRATFLCRPTVSRPAARLAPALVAAGDYIDGPYPATLEGAVRSGHTAVTQLF